MNVGFVSTWLERGATYVTKTYMKLLEEKHQTYVYARGGEKCEKGNPNLDFPNVTWGLRLGSTQIDWNHFSKWIKKNKLDVIFFNEQKDILIVTKIKKEFPNIKLGAYIDYYTEDTVKDFEIYDFLICNTKRHYSVFKWHKGAYYVPWGTDLELFEGKKTNKNTNEIVFFHSVGMSARKGTKALIEAYINGKIYEMRSKLIIHSQINLDHIISKSEAEKYKIELIIKEVPHPGLYYLGDIYVYPTTLDGLGLTIYEALASGMPVITTNCGPMNEVISDDIGKLIDVDYYRTRNDGYYWPLSIVKENSLIAAMKYYCDNRELLLDYQRKARTYAEENLNINDRKEIVRNIFQESELKNIDKTTLFKELSNARKKQNFLRNRLLLELLLPNFMKHKIRSKIEEKRFNERK